VQFRQPIEIAPDLTYRVGYVTYRRLVEGESFAESGPVMGPNGDDLDVVVDWGPNGEVVGIELLGLDPE